MFLLENIEVVALPLEAFLLKHHADTHGAVRNTTVEKMEARVTQDLLVGWHYNRHQLILSGTNERIRCQLVESGSDLNRNLPRRIHSRKNVRA